MSIDQTPRSGFDTRSLTISVAAILVLTAVAALALAWAWDDLPERVATHWNGSGEADGFSDRSTRLALLLVALPAALSVALAVLMSFVPRGAPGSRWISAIPVGLAAAVFTTTIGSTLQQRNGGDASIGWILLAMLVFGFAATAAVVPLLPAARVAPATSGPPPDAARLDTSGEVWWTGRAQMSALVLAGVLALCVVPAIVLAVSIGIGWIIALILLIPALAVVASGRFVVTIGGDHVVVSGRLFGWPRLVLPLDTITMASTRSVSLWEYGGIGLRYGPRGTGVITRGGEALVLERSDGNDVAITCDDAATAAATINTLRSRTTG